MQELAKEHLIAGVDEAGRGPLAGPVVAAAVILDPRQKIDGLNDSKQLTEKQRLKLFDEIRAKSLCWSVARGTVREIYEINILQASLLAMKRAILQLKYQPSIALIDGNKCPDMALAAQAIIKGDESEPAISAASIVAKVLRDRLMLMMDKKYPQYGFAKHKGYSTKFHMEALRTHGPARIHRQGFAPVMEAQMKLGVE